MTRRLLTAGASLAAVLLAAAAWAGPKPPDLPSEARTSSELQEFYRGRVCNDQVRIVEFRLPTVADTTCIWMILKIPHIQWIEASVSEMRYRAKLGPKFTSGDPPVRWRFYFLRRRNQRDGSGGRSRACRKYPSAAAKEAGYGGRHPDGMQFTKGEGQQL